MSDKFSCHVIGEKSLLLKCSEILIERGHDIFGIVSSNPLIMEWAAEKKIKTLEFNQTLPDRLKAEPYDYLFSITNLSILSDEIINTPRRCAINFHDGPLPQYAGSNATSWAIMNQEKTHGITWHEISSEVDQGDILKQELFEIEKRETSLSLNAKCYENGLVSFVELVEELSNGDSRPFQQNLDDRSYYGKYKRPAQAAIINWSHSAEKILALVDALDFGRYTNALGLPKIKVGNEYFIVRNLIVTDIPSAEPPGVITSINDEHIRVATGTNDVEVTKGFSITGIPLSAAGLMYRYSLKPGFGFDGLSDDSAQEITKLNAAAAHKEDYWVEKLCGLEFIDLHYAKKNFTVKKNPDFTTVPIQFPKEVLIFFEELDSKPQIGLAAGFGLFVGRHCGKNEFNIGFSHAALFKNIGSHDNMFSKNVPVKVKFDPEAIFTSALADLSGVIEGVVQNKTYALDVWGRHPDLKQHIGNGGQPISPLNIVFTDNMDVHHAQPGNSVTLVVARDLRHCRIVFDPMAITVDKVKLFIEQFTSFLEDAVTNSEQSVAGLSILSPDERRRLLTEWNDTKVYFPAEKCVHQLFEEQVAKTPDATAIVYKGKSLSYRELNARCNQMAHRLKRAGVETETLVGVCLHRSLDMIVAVLGTLKAGGAYVPLDPSFPKDRISYMVENSECPVILTDKNLKDELGLVSANIITVDTEWNDLSKEKTTNPECRVAPDNLAYVIYTSGSTGKPKGVMIEHRNVVNFFTGIDGCGAHDPESTWLAVTTLSFDISVLELLWTMARGFRVVIYTGIEGNEYSEEKDNGDKNQFFDIDANTDSGPANSKETTKLKEDSDGEQDENYHAHSIPELIQEYEVTHFQCTPSMASLLMLDEKTKNAFGRLKKMLIGGEAFPASLAAQLQEVVAGDIINMYGPTETTVWSTTYKLDEIKQSIPIGRPIANTTIYILDENLQPVPLGVPGELMIGGAGVGRGYFKRPRLTAERFIKNPFSEDPENRLYRTGDLARYLPDGNIEFLGRMDHQVKIRGYRIELGEIEAVLNGHPTVHESVVIVREDVPGQKRLVAYVIPGKRENPTMNQLRDFAKEQLPDYMVPVHVVTLDAFPQTPNKKIDRKMLPMPDMGGIERDADFDPPRTDIEEALSGLWAEILGVQQVGRNENFFDIGGESLSATLIILSIKRTCNVDIPLHSIFRAPTVAALAAKLEEAFLDMIETESPGAASSDVFQPAQTHSMGTALLQTREEDHFEPPTSRTEKVLASIWTKVLRLGRVGRKDHFFYLGGKSIDAVYMFAEIEKVMGSKLPLSILLKAPTLEQLAIVLDEDTWEHSWSPLVPIKPTGSKIPFFCIHAHRGNVLNYYPLANYLGTEQPFFGLQARGLDGKKINFRSFADMATDYLDEIRTVQPHGPYLIGGWCMGGYIALEMAHLLLEEGEEVGLVALIDTPCPSYPKYSPRTTTIHRMIYKLIEQIDYELIVMRGLKPKERASHLWRKVKTPFPPALAFVERHLEVPLSKIRLSILHSQAYKLHRLYDMHNKANEAYKPRPYPGRVAILRASKQPLGVHPDSSLGWGDLLRGKVDLREIPGHYLSLLVEPSVRLLADELKDNLNGIEYW
jgi:non-ribosomal peptide synthetase component F/thioesterase domain-containing protein/methionyl-tRNA formyltransferase/acyl carrier protein